MTRIVSIPDVCGGDPCFANTRIPVWVIVECRELGMSDEEILADHPALTREDLEVIWRLLNTYEDPFKKPPT